MNDSIYFKEFITETAQGKVTFLYHWNKLILPRRVYKDKSDEAAVTYVFTITRD